MADWQKNLSKSTEDFTKLVHPVLVNILGGYFYPVEGVTEVSFAKELDSVAGIDFWWRSFADEAMKGVANRIQWGVFRRTFTVRRSRQSGLRTEFTKRRKAIEGGWVYPQLTVQSYVSDDRSTLWGVGVIDTTELIQTILDGNCFTQQAGADRFYVVEWEGALACCPSTKIWTPSDGLREAPQQS